MLALHSCMSQNPEPDGFSPHLRRQRGGGVSRFAGQRPASQFEPLPHGTATSTPSVTMEIAVMHHGVALRRRGGGGGISDFGPGRLAGARGLGSGPAAAPPPPHATPTPRPAQRQALCGA